MFFSAPPWVAATALTLSSPSVVATLPVVAFPAATVPAGTKAGDRVKVSFKTTGQQEALYIYSGLSVLKAPIDASAMVTIPSNLQGISYGVISTAPNATAIADANSTFSSPSLLPLQRSVLTSSSPPTTAVAGPIVFNFPLSSGAVSSAP